MSPVILTDDCFPKNPFSPTTIRFRDKSFFDDFHDNV